MNRLVAFGCSNSYGHGLPDCFNPKTNGPGNSPSEYAWPALLGKSLGIPIVNASDCGVSNLEILNNILNFKFKKNDCVIIGWTYPERDMIFSKPQLLKKTHNIKIGSWIDETMFRDWCKIHSEYDMIVRNWYNVHHASLYLRSLGIEQHNFFVDHITMAKHKPKYIDVSTIDINFIKLCKTDTGLDGNHPGSKTHELVADAIKSKICK